MKKHILTIGTISLAILFSGCSISNSDNVSVVGSKSTTSNLKVTNLHTTHRGDLFLAQATITNNSYSNKTAQVFYRCIFYDNNQFQLDSASLQWVPVIVYVNEKKVIECSTTNPDAASFKVELSSSGEANKVYQ